MSGLGAMLRHVRQDSKASLQDLTVLSPQNDPFRLDTPGGHAKGRWFREHMGRCGLLDRAAPIHNRGIHYAIVSLGDARLPDGSAYINDADCWAFLEDASNTARWLGYVPWEAIFDARNAAPVIRIHEERPLSYRVKIEAGLYLPEADELQPKITASGFDVKQPYRLAFYGEKTSLGTVLEPLADRFGADLYLPSGEISNSLLARMARVGHEDSREMVVFIFADCDPAGYQMAVSIGHKLRALKEGTFPNLTFRIIVPALTVEQVKALKLPSTPLKETERRAGGWRERYGVEQTEIDALATLRPELLQRIAEEAVEPFFDATLARRVTEARDAWEAEAQQALDVQLDQAQVADIRARAEADLDALRAKLDSLEVATEGLDLDLPPARLPNPLLHGEPPLPLVSSDMPLVEHIRLLRSRKDYSGGGS
ncbi:MAG TPA: hypothetical protein VGN97_08240 [Mesorhizobium sp.]|jgi:hypothetical protein|nr:hypothetical protein [Mesorhizobium sp.]